MSDDNKAFLTTLIRAIHDACQHEITFNSGMTVSGFLCLSVAGDQQIQIVIDEEFRDSAQDDVHNSFCLKSVNFKSSKACGGIWNGESSQGLGISLGGKLPNSRRNIPRGRSTSTNQTNQRSHDALVVKSSLSRNTIKSKSPTMNYQNLSQGHAQTNKTNLKDRQNNVQINRKPQRSRVRGKHSMSRSTFSSGSLAPQLRTATRHFFRSTKRTDKNNTTFTLDDFQSKNDVNTTQNQITNKYYGSSKFTTGNQTHEYDLKDRKTKTLNDLSRGLIHRNNTQRINSSESYTISGKRIDHTFPRKMYLSTKSSLESVDLSEKRNLPREPINTMSYVVHHNEGNSNSNLACLSVTDIDTSCDYGYSMSDLDDNDYLSEQDISIANTEPPYGFYEHNIDPYEYMSDKQDLMLESSAPGHQFCGVQNRSTTSEPIAKSPSEPKVREVYSDGKILQESRNINKNRVLPSQLKERSNPVTKSITISENHAQKHEISSQEISRLYDDILNALSQSQHKDYMRPRQEDSIHEWNKKVNSNKGNMTMNAGVISPAMKYENINTESANLSRIKAGTKRSPSGRDSLKTSSIQSEINPNVNITEHIRSKTLNKDFKKISENCTTSTGYDQSNKVYANSTSTNELTVASRFSKTSDNRITAEIIGRLQPIFGSADTGGSKPFTCCTGDHGLLKYPPAVKGEPSSGSQVSTRSGCSAGPEVFESPSVIKKKSKLRKWMRIFRKDTSPLPLRDAHHTLSNITNESHISTNWSMRYRHRHSGQNKKNVNQVMTTKDKVK